MAQGKGSPKSLVVIIGTSNFEILESQTAWPIEVEKVAAFISYRCRLDFNKLFLLLLQCFGYIQFKE